MATHDYLGHFEVPYKQITLPVRLVLAAVRDLVSSRPVKLQSSYLADSGKGLEDFDSL